MTYESYGFQPTVFVVSITILWKQNYHFKIKNVILW